MITMERGECGADLLTDYTEQKVTPARPSSRWPPCCRAAAAVSQPIQPAPTITVAPSVNRSRSARGLLKRPQRE